MVHSSGNTCFFIWLLNLAASYWAIYQAIGLREKFERLILLSLAAFFANVVAPIAGMSGIAVFVSEARRRGYSSGRVTVAGVLFVLFDYLGFLCILTLGLIVLVRRNNLTVGEIIASLILVVIAAVLATLLYLGLPLILGLIAFRIVSHSSRFEMAA